MRVFLALTLPEETVAALERLQDELPVGRVVAPENLHLTLAFLGELPDAGVVAVHEALGTLKSPPFTLELGSVDTLGGRAPSVAYVGAAPNPALTGLHRRIRSRLHGAGLMLARERFLPHVTIARFRRGLAPADLMRLRDFLAAHGGLRLDPVEVSGFSLIRSTLGPGGPTYDELARYDIA